MWSDNETTRDLLGFRVHADLIYEMVTDPRLLPITVGVFADWGGGKSSVLRMLEERLNAEAGADGRYCLYVNGWLFEGYDDSKAALMGSILTQLVAHPTLGKRIKDKLLPLLKSVDYMRFIRLGLKGATAATFLSTIGIEPASALAVLGALAPTLGQEDVATEGGSDGGAQEHPADVVAIRDFRQRFSEALLKSNVQSLVVLVDDLDRCSPSRIIENLEAIKLFLNVDHTAFVIGADPRLVRHAIRLHYRGLSGGNGAKIEDEEQIVNDYLEKLIHVPFGLPRLSVPEVQTYMSMLFCEYQLGDDAFGRCKHALAEHVSADRYSPHKRTTPGLRREWLDSAGGLRGDTGVLRYGVAARRRRAQGQPAVGQALPQHICHS
ncbi:MAG: hypothetical protein HON70_04520 [Lentisphaerae bacterium]|mgnify:CR=1 FL=1|nr:hypothetical protein [Lentisphaerota bacterium]